MFHSSMSRIVKSFFQFILFLAICCLPATAFCQVDSILSLPEAERYLALGTVFGSIGRDYHGGASEKLEALQGAFEKK